MNWLMSRMARVFSFLAILGIVSTLTFTGALASTVAAQATPAASPVAGSSLESAVAWLVSQQAEDGSFVGFSGEPDAGTTVDAILALAAARHANVDTSDAIDLALEYLGTGDIALVYTQTGVGQSAKLAQALVAAGEDPASFANVMPMTIIENGINPDTNIYGTGIYDHALAILAMVATDTEVPAAALDALEASQSASGGWAFDGTTDDANVDSNTTSMVVQALVAADEGDSPLVESGVAYLESTWTDSGATYNTAPDSIADANSTALVVQAIAATGADVSDKLPNLETFQVDGGALCYQLADPTPNLLATIQAIPAIAGVSFPVMAH